MLSTHNRDDRVASSGSKEVIAGLEAVPRFVPWTSMKTSCSSNQSLHDFGSHQELLEAGVGLGAVTGVYLQCAQI